MTVTYAKTLLTAAGLATLMGFHYEPATAGEINTGYFGNVAIRGYDPVAYFTQQQPVLGSEAFSLDWLGATWLFANDGHRQLFQTNPVKYAPQYGGHCADGVAYGDYTANIDPEAWRIIDGKLYLNYAEGAAEEHESLPEIREKAEANWPEFRARLLANKSASLHE